MEKSADRGRKSSALTLFGEYRRVRKKKIGGSQTGVIATIIIFDETTVNEWMGGGDCAARPLQRDKTSLSRGHEEQFTNRKLPKIGKPFRDRRSFPPLNSDFDSIFLPPPPLSPFVQS